ncbi:hypothetical protein OG739_36215 [Streptomyces longwoodensis]|uniref:hypothetical protein n=1 Tax=Streptomyces longwoodensis TaxID=68231 RepID=UPI00225A38A2|nr:hypothetical protein [Streptomyces longwoodensis]MCX5000747.1 hypothetical protein [Streptomyces longwoodensis]WUC55777.1 hypothetical protein OHA09_01065 [Streptomyces longwoodensis]WUC62104.1 hypothetical protein OHA09_35910 [Streptomyces longwoodensis]
MGCRPGRCSAAANDRGQETSLAAVTACSSRSKADQDPAQWLPPAVDARCRCTEEGAATKPDRNLDESEVAALHDLADNWPLQNVEHQPAP